MKQNRFLYKSLILLSCLLLFAVVTPAVGGEAEVPDAGAVGLLIDDGGGDVSASLFINDVDYGHGFKYIAALDFAVYISSAIYKAPFIVQHRSGIASARYGKIKARSPDKILISASFKGKKLIKSVSHFDGLSPGPLITV